MSSLLELGLADESLVNALGSGCHRYDELMLLLRFLPMRHKRYIEQDSYPKLFR